MGCCCSNDEQEEPLLNPSGDPGLKSANDEKQDQNESNCEAQKEQIMEIKWNVQIQKQIILNLVMIVKQ